MTQMDAPSGLEGLIVAETTTGDVRGEEGLYHYRGYDATELARHATFEDVWHLLLVGHLPDDHERAAFAARLADARTRLPQDALRNAATVTDGDPMARIRTVWSAAATALGCRPWGEISADQRLEQAIALSAAGPRVVAAALRPQALATDEVTDEAGDERAPRTGVAADHLRWVSGREPTPEQITALERYLIATIDHGLNASTFTARTVTSTGADLGAVLVAALGALSGPLHGGAPSRALEMLDAIGAPEHAEPWVRAAMERGERIMGFGHRVYRTEDPRAGLLRATARELGGDRVALALHVEKVVRSLLAERHAERPLDVNVEYWAAVVLDTIGLPPAWFTPTFAIARSVGWMAHALEQLGNNRIMRPSARYVGPPPPRPLP